MPGYGPASGRLSLKRDIAREVHHDLKAALVT
jgi:hypothetical protein